MGADVLPVVPVLEVAGEPVLATVVGVLAGVVPPPDECWFTARFGLLPALPRLEPETIPVPPGGALATV